MRKFGFFVVLVSWYLFAANYTDQAYYSLGCK